MVSEERVVHHSWNTISTLMRRARNKLSGNLYMYLELLRSELEAEIGSTDTIYTYLNAAFLFLKYMDDIGKQLEEIRQHDIKLFLAKYKNPSTRTVKLRAIRWLAKTSGIRTFHEAAYKVKYPKIKTQIPYIADKEAVEKIIEHASQPYKTILIILYETGMRRSEVLNLKYGDVKEWNYGYKLVIRRSKSEPRAVYVIKYQNILREWLKQHRSKDPEDWLFYSLRTGNHIRPSMLTMHIHRLAKRLGLDPKKLHLHPHALRHLRATELYKARKLSEKELMILFGWKTRKMIDVYARIIQEDVEQRLIEELYGYKQEQKQEYKICPRCGTPNPYDAKYCYKCGLPLTEEKTAEKIREEERKQKKLKKLVELLMKHYPELVENLAQS